MTLLTVDVGNSQTVLATFDGPRRLDCWRVTTAPKATADELRMLWRGLLRDTTHAWTVPLALLFAVAACLLLTGLGAARDAHVGRT